MYLAIDGNLCELQLSDGLLRAIVRGRITDSYAHELVLRVAEMAQQSHLHAFLFDVREALLLPEAVATPTGHLRAAALRAIPGARLALLCRERTPDYVLLERTAANYGLRLIASTDEFAALEWLNGRAEPRVA